MKWIKTCLRLPPQGKKILYFDEGDCWVAVRIGKYWFPWCFTDSKFCRFNSPELWSFIDFPGNFEGLVRVGDNIGNLVTLDQLEKSDPDIYNGFLEMILSSVNITIME